MWIVWAEVTTKSLLVNFGLWNPRLQCIIVHQTLHKSVEPYQAVCVFLLRGFLQFTVQANSTNFIHLGTVEPYQAVCVFQSQNFYGFWPGRTIPAIIGLVQNKNMDSTPHCSRVVPHPSTERAQTALTSVFGWEPVHYGWYGRIRSRVLQNKTYHKCSSNRLP